MGNGQSNSSCTHNSNNVIPSTTDVSKVTTLKDSGRTSDPVRKFVDTKSGQPLFRKSRKNRYHSPIPDQERRPSEDNDDTQVKKAEEEEYLSFFTRTTDLGSTTEDEEAVPLFTKVLSIVKPKTKMRQAEGTTTPSGGYDSSAMDDDYLEEMSVTQEEIDDIS